MKVSIIVRDCIFVRMGFDDNSYFRFQSHQEGAIFPALYRPPAMVTLDA